MRFPKLGWRVKVALAQALFVSPDVLLLDEPTNHLSLNHVLWLQKFLNDYEKCVVVVSHDRAFLNAVATDIIHFVNKKLHYYPGAYEDFVRITTEKRERQKHLYDWQVCKFISSPKLVSSSKM